MLLESTGFTDESVQTLAVFEACVVSGAGPIIFARVRRTGDVGFAKLSCKPFRTFAYEFRTILEALASILTRIGFAYRGRDFAGISSEAIDTGTETGQIHAGITNRIAVFEA